MRLEGSCYCCQLDTLTILLAAESPFCFNAFLSLSLFLWKKFFKYFSSSTFPVQVLYLVLLLYLLHTKVNKLFKLYIYIYISEILVVTKIVLQIQSGQVYREEKNNNSKNCFKVVFFLKSPFFLTSIRYFLLLEFLKQFTSSSVSSTGFTQLVSTVYKTHKGRPVTEYQELIKVQGGLFLHIHFPF